MSDETQESVPEIRRLYDITSSRVDELTLSLLSKRQKYYSVCRMLKKHGVGYIDFQQEAYALKLEIDAIKKELTEIQVQYVTAKRQYEREHGLNQVKRLVPVKGGLQLTD
jgi:hypothetical protein